MILNDEAFQKRLLSYEGLRQRTRLLPVKVSSFYQKKLNLEFEALAQREGPLHRVIFPSEDRLLQPHGLKEVDDHVEDRSHMPIKKAVFLHKYADRILFMPTSECLSHCMYCFRQDFLEEQHESSSPLAWKKDLDHLLEYLKTHPEVQEVILSGGDPFILPAKVLNSIFVALKNVGIPHLRVHTRSLVFNPGAFSPHHLEVCLKFDVRVVLHVVHPYEWCEQVSQKAQSWSKAGVRLYNQFPILRKINDHPKVLSTLIEKLEKDRVRTHSIYFPDPVQYSSCFRIPFLRLKAIIKEFQRTTPSWINGLRFSQDSPIGKLSPDELVSIDHENHLIHYRRGDETVSLPDLPEHLDQTFDLKTLLWKGA